MGGLQPLELELLAVMLAMDMERGKLKLHQRQRPRLRLSPKLMLMPPMAHTAIPVDPGAKATLQAGGSCLPWRLRSWWTWWSWWSWWTWGLWRVWTWGILSCFAGCFYPKIHTYSFLNLP